MVYEGYQVVLQSRPGRTNPPREDNFAYVKAQPIDSCKDGEMIVKTLYLSVDPYMRFCMNDPTGFSAFQPWPLNEPLYGNGVGQVIESKHKGYAKGDIVKVDMTWPWKNYVVFTDAEKVEDPYLKEHPSLLLGLCGLTGLTSYVGLEVQGHIVAGENQAVVVSGAAGACGIAAGQIAKLCGSGKVVGICGTDEKCQYIKELGFDGAINYKTTSDMGAALKQHCPQGVDVYFDNVGGTLSDEVIKLMNKDSHVVLVGQIAKYNDYDEFPPPLLPEIQEIITKQNISREFFYFLQFPERVPAALKQLVKWVQEGKIKGRETVEVGLETMGKAFTSMMKGGNVGKQLVKVADLM